MFNLTKARGILKTTMTSALLTSTIILSGFDGISEEETQPEVHVSAYEIPTNIVLASAIELPKAIAPVNRVSKIQYVTVRELAVSVIDYKDSSVIKGINQAGTVLTVRANLSNGWYELLDGGYIREEYVEVREELGNRIFVKITADTLNVRTQASAHAKRVGALPQGELRSVIAVLENGWYQLLDGNYVNGKYTERLDVSTEKFYSMVEERKQQIAKAEAERKAKQVAAKATQVAKQQTRVATNHIQTAQQATSTQASMQGSNAYRAITLTKAERDLLAKLVYCEANVEPFKGQVAVAQVVFNRVLDSRFPNSIEGVIKARGQFVPVSTGKIYNVNPTQENYDAIDEALKSAGINGAVYFHNPKYANDNWWRSLTLVASIGSHAFKK